MATFNPSTSFLEKQISGKVLARNIIHPKNIPPATHLHSNSIETSHVTSLLANSTPAIQLEPKFPKPTFSYSCLMAMALKNSRSGSLLVSEIYSFICEHFPYYKTAPAGWKNSIRHNLSLNKCFKKVEETVTNGGKRQLCLWTMNPEKILKMDKEVQKWSSKDRMAIRHAMVFPEHLEALVWGEMKHGSSSDSDVELESQSEVDVEELYQEMDKMYGEEDEESSPQQQMGFDIKDSSGPNLDFYISDSLQDMLDIDIRSEVATLVGGSNEFSSIVNDLPSSFDHVDSMSNDAPASSTHKLNNAPSWLSEPTWSSSNDYYADVGACVNPISVMPIISSSMIHRSPKTTLNTNGLRNTSSPPASPVENKSHLHFSPQQMRISSLRPEQKNLSSQTNQQNASNIILQRKNIAIDSIKKDLSSELRRSPTSLINNVISSSSTTTSSSSALNQQQSRTTFTATSTATSSSLSMTSTSNGMINSNGIMSTGTNTIKLAPGIGGLTFANSITYNKLKQNATTTKSSLGTLTNGNTIVLKRDRDSSPLHNMATLNGSTSFMGNQISGKILARNVIHTKNISPATHLHSSNSTATSTVTSPLANSAPTMISVKPSKIKIEVESEFPKPAYSYSCLIAMALKNSRSGSLPVSEIYSFMCEHFPYFKTARSGWKNSVRHNLSMNKCFEKVEKPATNGGQRKGCLWAMNPQKILKMDEEVQKWSRKDPMAIRNAMVFPEHLEALERGEMKHGSTGESDVELDSQSEVEETSDSEELDQELDETIVETHEMYVEEDDDSGPQQHRDFDIEVEDIYDAIDMEDDKDAVRRAINSNDIIEMTSSPSSSTDTDYNSPKRSRLSVNYSIGPAGEIQQQFKQHTHQQQNHQQQIQHTHMLTTTPFQPQNRRKMQLVNRIA